jgi:magnesium-transporting ATPase (P-type)
MDPQVGIPDAEKADNYAQRREKWGDNVLPDPPAKTWLQFFKESLSDMMLRILLLSAFLSLILTSAFPEGARAEFHEYLDTISILIVVILVSCFQTHTNYKQQAAMQEIVHLKNDFHVNVIRGGAERQIQSTEVLVGDILSLRNGDRVAADGLYLSGRTITIDNSQETGESAPVLASEDFPFVLTGGAVVSGEGKVLAVAVWRWTQSGRNSRQLKQWSRRSLHSKRSCVTLKSG